MKIIEIKSQMRRDFIAEIECEGCNVKEEISGYDDDYYHNEVLPERKCKSCGKSRKDLGIVGEKTKTKYASSEVV